MTRVTKDRFLIFVFGLVLSVFSVAGEWLHCTTLDSDGKYHVCWNISQDSDDQPEIEFMVEVETNGYVGFGLSPNGGMAGSDLVTGWIKDGNIYFQDRHAKGNFKPEIDESEDWHLISGSETDTHTILSFRRKLDTCDKEDIKIDDSTIKLIYAYSDEDPVSKNDITYHKDKRGSKSALLLQKGTRNLPILDKSTLSYWDILSPNEREALGSIIGQFLSKKDVEKAFELATTFGYQCNDLFIIRTCFDLARGERDVNSADSSLPDVAPDVSSSRIIRSLLLWITTGSNAISADQKVTIKCIERLSRKCTIAVPICHQILVHCVIAMVLDESYESVSKERDAFSTLKRILVLKLKDEHILAKSLIVVHELADKEVAKFLCEEIWHSLQKLGSSNLVMIPEETNAFSEEVIYDPLRTTEGFQLIVKLCKDPSVLGTALMGIFSVESAELSPNSTDQNFTLLADLCICAHECFTAACNMDGISQILHSSQMLVSLLEEADKFPIMVYLFVGLGRYSEMMYVFDILKSNEKLNILFEKDMEHVPDLRLALLDYLKRCPASECDKYFYDLASRFRMYREKAEILEMSVQKMLSQLCKKNTDNNLKEELEKALQVLSDAAKSYCEADCLHQAQSCMRLAQLIALQIYFVPAGIWIIGLNESSVTRFITDHDKFSQAYIVAEEYDKHHLWSQALLHNVVLRGDREYLHDFKCCISLSTSLITEVAKKFAKLPVKSESSVQNMKLLLSLCSNVKTKYSLASELGFSDMISELLMGEASAYLQDLMANGTLR